MNNKGFTLVELLAVIIILSLLAILSITPVTKLVKDSKEELYETQVLAIKTAAETWGADNLLSLPDSGECKYITLQNLKEYGLMDSSVVDPRTNEQIPNDFKIYIVNSLTLEDKQNITYELEVSDSNDCNAAVINYVAKIGDKKYMSLVDAINNAQSGDIIDVIRDTTSAGIGLSKTLTLMSSTGSTVTFNTAVNGANINIVSGTLTIDNGITLKGSGTKDIANRLINIRSGAILILNAGATIGYNSFKNSNGVGNGGCVTTYSGGNFTMNGGTITNCTAAVDGGAVYVSEGSTFNMNGGLIANSKANHGGGIFTAKNSEFTMKNSKVTNCTAQGKYTSSNGGAAGGGLYINNATPILGNDMTDYILGYSTYIINSEITNCHTEGKGGGIYIGATDAVSATIESSIIQGNSAGPDTDGNGKDGQGGGIYLAAPSSLTLINSIVNNNTSTRNGADIHFHTISPNFIEQGTNTIGIIYYYED